jgi:hypothetical protein
LFGYVLRWPSGRVYRGDGCVLFLLFSLVRHTDSLPTDM